MRYRALACDYDGTLAEHGQVEEGAVAALERLRASGRRLVLVTGRELDHLHMAFAHSNLFDAVVAENGAVLYLPDTGAERLLGEPPPERFVASLRERGVLPLSVGRAIVSTWRPNEAEVMAAIRDLGLELQLVFNKGAVMVLPPGVNKASGLRAALHELGLSPRNVVGVGDAENDHAFLALCECAVAVRNALPTLRERADLVTAADHGAGVAELAARLLETDLREEAPRLRRLDVALGGEGAPRLHPYGQSLLVTGAGAARALRGPLSALGARGYQLCVVDPRGECAGPEDAVVLGDGERPPGTGEVLSLLRHPELSAVTDLRALPETERAAFAARLLPKLFALRAATGRPHFVVIGDADALPEELWSRAPPSGGLIFIVRRPERAAALRARAELELPAEGAARC